MTLKCENSSLALAESEEFRDLTKDREVVVSQGCVRGRPAHLEKTKPYFRLREYSTGIALTEAPVGQALELAKKDPLTHLRGSSWCAPSINDEPVGLTQRGCRADGARSALMSLDRSRRMEPTLSKGLCEHSTDPRLFQRN